MGKIDVKSDSAVPVKKVDLSPDDIQAQIDKQMNSVIKKSQPAKATIAVVDEPKHEEPVANLAPAVSVLPKVEVKKVATKPTEPAVVSHRGKILDLRPVAAEVKEETLTAPELNEPKPEKAPDVKTEVKIPEPEQKPTSEPERIGDISQEIKDREAEKEAEKEDKKAEQQQPHIFDTNQYHLPIKAIHHHGAGGNSTMLLLLVLIVALLSAYIAADMGFYDPGIELPYDIF